MALSKEEKEALADHYKGKDLYDPSTASEQEVPSFQPKSMSGGGDVVGYADGGAVNMSGLEGLGDVGSGDFSGPVLSSDTDTVKGSTIAPRASAPPLKLTGDNFNPPALPAAPPVLPVAPQRPAVAAAPQEPTLPLPGSSAPPLGAPAATADHSKLSPNQFDELIQGLKPSMGQKLGRGAFSALAGLADAIETGVARAPNPGFQKGMDERAQNQKENLIKALREKYEAGYKGQELEQGQGRLAEEVRAHGASEKEAQGRLAEEKRQHDLESGQRGATLKFEQDKETREAGQAAAKEHVDAAQKVIEAYEKSGYSPFAARPSQAEYNAAKEVIKSTGTAGGFAPGAPRVTKNGIKYTVNK